MNRKEIAVLAIIIFATVTMWIFFDVLHAKNTSTVSQKELRQVVPLTATFDNDIIKKLSSREE